MIIDSATFKLVIFQEYKALRPDQDNGLGLEVILDGEFSMIAYCQFLFNKIFNIKASKISDFLDYQCNQFINPILWLNSLEKLVNLNDIQLEGKRLDSRYIKLISQFDIKRHSLQTAIFDDSKQKRSRRKLNGFSDEKEYSFSAVQEQLEKYNILEEKISFLQDQITDYQQNPPVFVSTIAKPFDSQCELEIVRLERQDKLMQQVLEKKAKMVPETISNPKIRINTNINVLVDVFFQLMRNPAIGGKPVLDATISQVANLINQQFLDKEGNDISISTVSTILDPNKHEKRPKGTKRIQLDEFDE
jgi:hypothetical protein